MLLWVGFAVLAAGVLVAVLRPLWATGGAAGDVDPAAVYRDQLAEIATDRERGLIDQVEAEAARIEIARRLLAASGEAGERGAATPPPHVEGGGSGAATSITAPTPHRRLAAALGICVPLAAIAIYLAVGAPGRPDMPLSARLKAPIETADVARLIASVEARLAAHPEDGQGWDVIAPVYLRMGAFAKAIDAYARAMRILGETPKRLAGFAEATVLANDGTVTEAAREAWEKLARLDPARPEPRFWLAMAKEQAGSLEEAAAEYKALLAGAEADAPWRPLLEERIAAIEARRGEGRGSGGAASGTGSAPRGPSEADIAAADKLAPADRQRMIEGMVEGLAAKLAADGRDLTGWQRLIRAYAVLGRREKALDALRSARGHFRDEQGSMAALAELARSLGLET